MSVEIEFVVPGPCVPKERPRVVRGRAHTPKRTADYEALVARCARAAARQATPRARDDWSVEIELFYADKRIRDIDNCLKSLLDGVTLSRVAWVDDSQVVDASISKRLGMKEAATVVRLVDLSLK